MKAFFDASPPYLLSLAAVFCFFLAVWLAAYRNKIVAATLLGGLFFLCVMLAYFPKLDSITALGVNVKSRQTLDRAEEILTQLRQLAITNAKGVYLEMASVGRWGSPSARVKQAIIDATNERLVALGVSDAERKEIVQPVIESIGPDLDAIYREVLDALLTWKYVKLSYKYANRPPETTQDELRADREHFNYERDTWKRLAEEFPYPESKTYDLAAHLRADTPAKMLNDRENEIAVRFMSDVQSLYDGCRAKDGYTPEACAILRQVWQHHWCHPQTEGTLRC